MRLRLQVFSWRLGLLAEPWYWRTRLRLTQTRGITAYAVSQSAAYARETRSMAWILAKTFLRVALSIIVAVACVVGTQIIGERLPHLTALWVGSPVWVTSTASWLGLSPANMNYQAVVAAALAVTGTLVGVYFATVAFVVSTTYKDATAQVRALVTRLPGGRVYAATYVQVVLFSLIVLMLPIADRQPNRLTLCVMVVLGGFVVLSFGRIRAELYGLLEPAELLQVVRGDLTRWIAQASRQAGRDPSGVRISVNRARTYQSLLVLRDLCYLIRERERASKNVPSDYLRPDPRVVRAARSVRSIWLDYARKKQQLVHVNGWCYKRPVYKDWLLASDTEVSIALDTATTLAATDADDILWVERHLVGVLGELVGGREVPELELIVSGFDETVLELVSYGMFAESRLWLEAVALPAMSATKIGLSPVAEGSSQDAASNLNVADLAEASSRGAEGHLFNLVDFILLAHTQAVLGLNNYVRIMSAGFPAWVVDHALGTATRNIGPLPGILLTNIADGLRFELVAEGRRVTSDANITQLTARALAAEAIDEATALMAVFEEKVWPWVAQACDGNPLIAGAVLSRFDEAIHKWDGTLAAMSAFFEKCESVHRDVDDQWPDLSLDLLNARRSALADALRMPIAKLATRVDTTVDTDRPDIFGWAFYRAHQNLLEDVLSNEQVRTDVTQRLNEMFVVTDRAGRRLLETVQRQHDRVRASFWSEPSLMLLQVSGVALVAGLARGRRKVFEVFESVWRGFLDKNPQHILDVALSALEMDDALYALSSGKFHRSGRHQNALAAIQEMDVIDAPVNEAGSEMGGRSKVNIGRLLRNVEYGDFEDVFVAVWLIPEACQRGAVLADDQLSGKLRSLIRVLTDHEDEDEDGEDW